MSIERIFHCDWHECDGHARTAENRPPMGIIAVEDDSGHSLHFCTWDCLLKFAAEKPPAEIIPMGEPA